MRRPSQNAKLITALKRRWVTPLDALKIAGTMRFSARMLEIRRAGHKLREMWLESQRGTRVKAFRIAP